MIRIAAPNATRIAKGRPPFYDAGDGPSASRAGFLQYAVQSSGGFTPLYFVDFQANQAIINGAPPVRIASIPSLTGTLNLGPAGHTIATAANVLVMPATGITYPCTLVVQFTRTTDSGFVEVIIQLDSGLDTDRVGHILSSGDVVRLNTVATAVTAVASAPSAISLNVRYKVAGRVQTNSIQAGRNPGTMGTETTTAALPAGPANIRVGNSVLGTAVLVGTIARFAVIPAAATAAQLQAIVQSP